MENMVKSENVMGLTGVGTRACDPSRVVHPCNPTEETEARGGSVLGETVPRKTQQHVQKENILLRKKYAFLK